MFASKRAGRNRVTTDSGELTSNEDQPILAGRPLGDAGLSSTPGIRTGMIHW